MNEPLIYLRTGRKTVPIDNELDNRERWRRLQVRYVVYLERQGLPDPAGPRRILYRSPRHKLSVAEN